MEGDSSMPSIITILGKVSSTRLKSEKKQKKQKKSKSDSNKAKPSDLGSGAARRAAEKLKGRKQRLDSIIDGAGGKPRKGMKGRRG